MLDEHVRPEHFGILPYFHLFGLKISSYTVFMLLALASAFLAFKLTKTSLNKENEKNRILIVLTALLGGILGAKIPIWLANTEYWFTYPQNLSLLFSGRTIVGGLFGGFLAVILLKRKLHLKIKTGNDIAAPAALGMAVGRLGCFFAGCCYGIQVPHGFPFGVDFGDGVLRFPTQLYELVFDLALFFLFLHLKKTKELKPGILFFYLLNSYFIFRFFLEFIRVTDKVVLFISYYQLLCLMCLVAINFKHFISERKGKTDEQQL